MGGGVRTGTDRRVWGSGNDLGETTSGVREGEVRKWCMNDTCEWEIQAMFGYGGVVRFWSVLQVFVWAVVAWYSVCERVRQSSTCSARTRYLVTKRVS